MLDSRLSCRVSRVFEFVDSPADGWWQVRVAKDANSSVTRHLYWPLNYAALGGTENVRGGCPDA
jgi:hypothetical protein